MSRSDARTVLLIQPRMGFSGAVIRHAPLSLVYAAAGAVQRGHRVELLDLRLARWDWREVLRARLGRGDVMLVGLSVMSGIPVVNSVEVSSVARREFGLPVVWGGPHPTVAAEEILQEQAADFAVRGYGSAALADLADYLAGGGGPLAEVPGLSYRDAGGTVHNPRPKCFERLHYTEVPYQLIDPNIEKYIASGEDRAFPIYTSLGCHGGCSFCISPLLYRGFKQHWVPLDPAEVHEHMAHLRQRWGVNYFYLYDDDSFVKPEHILGIMKRAAVDHPETRWGFRGIRIDRILDLSDEDIRLLVRCGGHMMHIGVESGSDNVLRILNKRITVEQSLEANRRLAGFEEVVAAYNWIMAVPGETFEDLLETRDLMYQLAEDNPRCIYFHPNRFIPLPGTRLFKTAVEHGFEQPRSQAEWAKLDNELTFSSPWLDERSNKLIDLLQLATYFLDGRDEVVRKMMPTMYWPFLVSRAAYRPLLDLRLKNAWSGGLVEMRMLSAAKLLARGYWAVKGD